MITFHISSSTVWGMWGRSVQEVTRAVSTQGIGGWGQVYPAPSIIRQIVTWVNGHSMGWSDRQNGIAVTIQHNGQVVIEESEAE